MICSVDLPPKGSSVEIYDHILWLGRNSELLKTESDEEVAIFFGRKRTAIWLMVMARRTCIIFLPVCQQCRLLNMVGIQIIKSLSFLFEFLHFDSWPFWSNNLISNVRHIDCNNASHRFVNKKEKERRDSSSGSRLCLVI